MIDSILPDWPAPRQVRGLATTRRGGCSLPPYAGLNLGDHVHDDPRRVAENRSLLGVGAALPAEPRWLNQVHGCSVASWETRPPTATVEADAATTTQTGLVCAVLTADCLPVLLCNERGSRVAVAHAGWRGLAAGVVEAAISCFDDEPRALLAWLGPAIGPDFFEVGDEVREIFLQTNPEDASCFRAHRPGHWLADIYHLARNRMTRAGLLRVWGGGLCTFSDGERFYSYRRERVTGRMATLIWIAGKP